MMIKLRLVPWKLTSQRFLTKTKLPTKHIVGRGKTALGTGPPDTRIIRCFCQKSKLQLRMGLKHRGLVNPMLHQASQSQIQ
jgi:hypothetical protein